MFLHVVLGWCIFLSCTSKTATEIFTCFNKNNIIMQNIRPHDLIFIIKVDIICVFSQPILSLASLHFPHFSHCSLSTFISLLALCLIYFPSSHPFFLSLPPSPFSSCFCLHLLITHSVSSSITPSGLPPSHLSFSACPSHLPLSPLNPSFIQCSSKRNTTPSTVSLCMMHLSHVSHSSPSYLSLVSSLPFSLILIPL